MYNEASIEDTEFANIICAFLRRGPVGNKYKPSNALFTIRVKIWISESHKSGINWRWVCWSFHVLTKLCIRIIWKQNSILTDLLLLGDELAVISGSEQTTCWTFLIGMRESVFYWGKWWTIWTKLHEKKKVFVFSSHIDLKKLTLSG
jgi:hypothetical protein